MSLVLELLPSLTLDVFVLDCVDGSDSELQLRKDAEAFRL